MDTLKIATCLESHEEWLMLRMLEYAKQCGYTRYTSTLAEAWRAAVKGLSAALIQALNANPDPPIIGPDEDFANDPIAGFGILQARRHRTRGVTLAMFLGMMKYCRQAFQDLLQEGDFSAREQNDLRQYLDRFFDRIELGFCTEWTEKTEGAKLDELQDANRRLTNEKNLYLTLFESLQGPVLFFGPDHKLINLNHAAANLFAGKSIPGASYYGHARPTNDLDWLVQRLRELSPESPELSFTTSLQTQGQPSVFQVRLKRMLDVSVKFIGTAVVLEDVSELKSAQTAISAARDFYLKLFEDFPALIWRAGKDARCNYFNRTWLDFTGRSLSQETGDGWTQGVHPEDLEGCLQTYQQSFPARRPFAMEYRLRHHSGEYRWINHIGRPFHDLEGRFAGYIGSCYDISESKQSQQRLNELLVDLQRSNQELENFAYVASHDLQEPLRMITGYIQLLSRRYQGRLDQDADDFIGFAVDGARRMEALIKDLLAYSRVGRKGQPPEKVDCNKLISTVLNNLAASIRESGAELRIGELPEVMADPLQLTQLFQNLVHNALKFKTDAAPRIEVRATPRGGFWEFAISDNGIGIDARHRERIFQIFQRLHPIGQYPGTGIGLAICKKIIDRHGGNIWVEGEPGSGTSFHFTLRSA
ncbi:hypothetical protein DESUT3_12790 [Desulfuromonas versatilis]|uniref:histidine kinase n=1 Tax=Desulfuromonas versatilis TaxID=2802975 RepID=A0ABN6DVY5_9BACT|nr:ATP-binding protein [Desulfuromonas versatilis]BCR04210.1 hypothetical protein DESUT3_12790 [Desulfuromonas versatilis]